MKTPKRIQPLVDDGLVDEVISRLMSGKEADIDVGLLDTTPSPRERTTSRLPASA